MRSMFSLVILSMLAACTTTGSGTPSLSGTEWRFIAIDGAGPMGGEHAMLSFQSDRLYASAGCNRMNSGWHSEGARIVLSGPMMATRMFCDGLMDQERAIDALLSDKPVVTVTKDAMALKSAQHSAELRRIRPL